MLSPWKSLPAIFPARASSYIQNLNPLLEIPMSNNDSQGRELLCTFTFSDGRRCRLPSYFTEPDLCYFHATKFRKQVNAEAAGVQIAKILNTDFLTACDLSNTFGALFSATARGFIKPKTATTLAYLGQLMLQTHIHAKQEFQEAFTEDSWRNAILTSFPDHDDEGDDVDGGGEEDEDESSSPASPNSESPVSIDSAKPPATGTTDDTSTAAEEQTSS